MWETAVCVGVVVPGGVGRSLVDLSALHACLAALEAHTGLRPLTSVVLLPDGPDAATAAALAEDLELAGYPQWGTVEPRGGAACLNRLAARSEADVMVLLENGVLVGPGWLSHLLRVLSRPGCGLAGPSTNVASSRQHIRTSGVGDLASVARSAAEARCRYGDAARTLEPDYDLGAFCYAVRREVLSDVGRAAEEFGTGPGWELDLNLRAARAGWHGVWVGAAYAYRTLVPDLTDHPLREANAERLSRLRESPKTKPPRRDDSSRPDYQADVPRPTPAAVSGPSGFPTGQTRPRGRPDSHHRPGDADDLRRPTAPRPAGPPRAAAATGSAPVTPAAGQPEPGWSPIRTSPASPSGSPLVSCIMPTRGRPDYASQSVRYFLAQDYPNAELVIVEDGARELAGTLSDDPRIRLVASDLPRSIGTLRNLACHHARGEVVVHWDDDDWHGPGRLSRQVAPIAAGEADITALRDAVLFELEDWTFWNWSAELHRRSFVRDVHGGTLAYRRQIWERAVRYPDRSLAEDAAFLDQAVRRGARLTALPADGVFVYVRHRTNSWRLTGSREGWQAQTEPASLAADRAFYADRSPAAPRLAPARSPLVSCIMPTMDRRPFVARSIAYFLRQSYPDRELVILDDGSDPVEDLVPADERIVYQRLARREVLGTKRNLACELARGELIAHWDDDDWQAPDRLALQVQRLRHSGRDLCGARTLRFYDSRRAAAWVYSWPHRGRIWAAGPTLCFTRDLWRRSPFPAVATGEDSRFVWSPAVTDCCDISDDDCVVAIIHDANTVPKAVTGTNWRPASTPKVEALLGSDLAFYRRQLGVAG